MGEQSCNMNESNDDSNSSKISGSNSSSSQDEVIGSGSQQGSSIGSAGSLVMRNHISSSGRKEKNNNDESNYAAVNIFLTTLGLGDLISIFKSERIDSHVLHYLEDDDLKDMSIPVGSRKKIMRAISERIHDLENDTPIEDS